MAPILGKLYCCFLLNIVDLDLYRCRIGQFNNVKCITQGRGFSAQSMVITGNVSFKLYYLYFCFLYMYLLCLLMALFIETSFNQISSSPRSYPMKFSFNIPAHTFQYFKIAQGAHFLLKKGGFRGSKGGASYLPKH